MRNLYAYRWTKILLACAMAIAFVVAAPFVTTTEKALENNTTAFSTMVEMIKQQAHYATLAQDSGQRSKASEAVGESLKMLLSSKYTSLLNDSTFSSDEFDVKIAEYPISNGQKIQRIVYTIRDRDRENRRYFLHHVGKNTFSSDIEYYDSQEHGFQVFEIDNKCFAFLIMSVYDHTSYSTDKMLSNYAVTVFTVGDDKFVANKSQGAMKISADQTFLLAKEGNAVKAVVPNAQYPPEYVFDSTKLAFALPKGPWISKAVTYDSPGLLLSLSNPDGDIRTLFIRKEGGRLRADSYDGQIIFLRKGKLFALKHYVQTEELEDGFIDIKKFYCVPLGEEWGSKNMYKPTKWQYCGSSDIPLFVSDEYVCYIQNSYFSGGGTYDESISDIRFDKLDDLSKFSFTYRMIPDFKEVRLAELVYGKKAADFYQQDNKTYGERLNPYVDFKQLSIKRNLGKWSLMLPIMEESFHPGNGSYHNTIARFAAFSNDVPVSLASNAEAMEMTGGWQNWYAKDLIAFPNSDGFLAQYDYVIGVGDLKNGDIEKDLMDLQIPVELDEYIVSISFAEDASMQEAWLSELNESRIN